jgi:hypothetical protein
MSHPLGLRAKLKGPQSKKRALMKHQANTYFIQVRLPAALQRSLRDASNNIGGDDGLATRSATPLVGRLHSKSSGLNNASANASVRLPLFSDDDLQGGPTQLHTAVWSLSPFPVRLLAMTQLVTS